MSAKTEKQRLIGKFMKFERRKRAPKPELLVNLETCEFRMPESEG